MILTAAEVRAAMAAHVLGPCAEGIQLGEITLREHQRAAVDRLGRLLEQFGGAILADDVGLGKTFVALALASRAKDPLVVAPAGLRENWRTSAERAGVAIRFVSAESLARNPRSAIAGDLILVDEAHHFRNANTARYAAMRALCASTRVVLLSATPVQNSLRDLRNVLALFLGQHAHAMREGDLSTFVVRRTEDDLGTDARRELPRLLPARWVVPGSDVDCLDSLLALPRAVPPSDGDDAGVLLTFTLAHQWASSRAALRAALTRRVAVARAMEDALSTGRRPTKAELAAWRFADGAQQLAFPELVTGCVQDAPALLEHVRDHADALRALLASLGATPDADRARAKHLLDIAALHPGERIVAFSEYAETVSSLYRLVAGRARAAMLTHGGGLVAGGVVSRRDILAQFTARGASNASDRIELLITTDVLSEGVDLHAASVVVHLDLAWNPARLEQRVGRLRRIGATRGTIAVYAFAPPAPAERLLQLDRRLRAKIGVAARSVGVAGAILPGLSPDMALSPVARVESLSRSLRAWRGRAPESRECIAASVKSSVDAVVACVRRAGHPMLVAIVGDRMVQDVADIEPLIAAAGGEDADVTETEITDIRRMLERWLRRNAVVDVVRLSPAGVARSRRTILSRVNGIAQRVRRHERSRLVPMLGAARYAATATMSAGAERVLNELAHAPMSDEAWLRAVGEFSALHGRRSEHEDEVLAVLVLGRPQISEPTPR